MGSFPETHKDQITIPQSKESPVIFSSPVPLLVFSSRKVMIVTGHTDQLLE